MSSSQDATSIGHDGLRIWSCVTCRRRKVRCDRRDPCQHCQKAGIECHFPVTGRLPRRGRNAAGDLRSAGASERQSALLGRIRRLESLVTEMAGQLEDASETGNAAGDVTVRAQDIWPASASESVGLSELPGSNQTSDDYEMISRIDSELDEDFGKLVVGGDGTMHIGKEFWSIFCSEVHGIFEAVQDSSSSSSEGRVIGAPDENGVPAEHDFLFQPNPFLAVYDNFPSRDHTSLLWDTFTARIDPFFNVLHRPSTDALIQSLDSDWGLTLHQDHQPLVLAIALAAVISLEPNETLHYLNEERDLLISRYRMATEQALSRAGFLTTRKLEVLQGFAIYVYALWLSGERQLAWSMAGSLTRAAVAMGLHTDPEPGDGFTSVSDTEVKRRLWWSIYLLESQTRLPNAPDLSISLESVTTRLPQDQNDTDLVDTMTTNSDRISGATLTLIHCDLAKLSRSLRSPTGIQAIPTQLQALYTKKAEISARYLSRVDPSRSFNTLVKTMTELFFSNAELVIYSQGHKQSTMGATEGLEADLVLTPAVAVLEHSWSIMSNAEWRIWRCHFGKTLPLKALGIVLNQVVHRPVDEVIKRAWVAADKVVVGMQSVQGDKDWKGVSDMHARGLIKMSTEC